MFHDFTRHALVAGLLAGVILTGCGNQGAERGTEAGWTRECPGDAFCFKRPASLVSQPVQIIDSLAALYRSDVLTLRFDMGQYGTSVDHLVNPVEEAATVDSRPARVLFTAREVVLLIPQVHGSGRAKVQFAMQLESERGVDRALARKIFQSIEFKPPR